MNRKLAEEFAGQSETMFALSNGYLGMRGTFEEAVPVAEPGVLLNGFYEKRPIVYGEHAYGFPRVGQSILACPDGTIIRLFINDEPFVATRAEVCSFHHSLDLKNGVLNRDIVWETAAGKRLRLSTRRLVSFAHRHLAAITYDLTLDGADADLVICSELLYQHAMPIETDDPRMVAGFVDPVLQPAGASQSDLRSILSYTTLRSGLVLGCGMDHRIDTTCRFTTETRCEDDLASAVFKIDGKSGKQIRIHKFLAYHYSDHPDVEQIRTQAGWTLDRAMEDGFDRILEKQSTDVGDFWRRADVEIECDDPQIQHVVRWNLFQLLQASERAEGHGIGARGLTGQTYEGHYFWDTEIYVLPFLIYTNPHAARAILKFRYDMLDTARARARELHHAGATFPWRTINGEEASAYYAAGTAQYHINADIAYAVRKYVEVTGDEDFLLRYGAEILVETARLWCDLGFFSERDGGCFRIHGVTGPDEYNAVVNDNFFTNMMARENMRHAADTVDRLQHAHPQAFSELCRRTCLRDDEPGAWRKAADLMYLPYDRTLGIHPQDDAFLDREHWDFANTPEDHYPLLLNYHPLNLYRSQVIKQADILLATFLLGDRFTAEEKKRNFDYYDPLTTHDSSLSVCIQSILASEIGYHDKALEYFRFAATMDLSDVGGNMTHGAHIASIGGTWMALIYGFAGMRDHGGEISFSPRLPKPWRRQAFCLSIRGNRLRCDIRPERTEYELVAGDGLTFSHCGEAVALSRDRPRVSCATPPLAPA